MRSRFGLFAMGTVLAFGLVGCGGTSEPSEGEMKDAMDYAMNHPPRGTRRRSNQDRLFPEGSLRRTHSSGLQMHVHREGHIREYRRLHV
jgi:hypothetical protein